MKIVQTLLTKWMGFSWELWVNTLTGFALVPFVWQQLRALGTIYLERPQILRNFWPLPPLQNTQKRVSLPKKQMPISEIGNEDTPFSKNCGRPKWIVPYTKPKLFLPEGVLISRQPRVKKKHLTYLYDLESLVIFQNMIYIVPKIDPNTLLFSWKKSSW